MSTAEVVSNLSTEPLPTASPTARVRRASPLTHVDTRGAAGVVRRRLLSIRFRTLFTVGAAMLGLWALIPQLLGADDVWKQMSAANWGWAAIVVGLSVATYAGAAIALDGSVSERLPLGPNIGVQLATTFAGVVVPGGGLVLTARFLQRKGIDATRSVAAIAVNRAAGFAVHLGFLAVFVACAGASGLHSFNLPSAGAPAVGAAAVMLVALLAVSMPRSRSMLGARVVPSIRRAADGIAETARQPSKLLALFGGSAVITLGYLLALQASILAFGPGPSFTSVAIVYLVGFGVSSVAPLPGGVGAVEVALVAGLTSAGMPNDTALGAVLLFRAATLWLPLLPGWIAVTVLRRSGDV